MMKVTLVAFFVIFYDIIKKGDKSMEKMKESLLEDIQKMIDFNINMIPNEELVEYYKVWFEEVDKEEIKHPKLIRWLKVQIDYWNEKDRQYGSYLKKLVGEK